MRFHENTIVMKKFSHFSDMVFRLRLPRALMLGGILIMISTTAIWGQTAPVVGDIPDQSISEGNSFVIITLDDYVTDADNAATEITWTYTGDDELTVTIIDRVATITAPAADWNGSETITFRATDPTLLFGEDAAVFTVSAINDVPVFNAGSYQAINEDIGAQTINTWAQGIDDGDPEVLQALTFNVLNDNPDLFSEEPAISSDGTLTYTALTDHFGTAAVTVTLTDDATAGGTALTTEVQTFTITVNPLADTPSVTNSSTLEDTQTNSGLVITRNVNDGPEVTHYKISNIQYGVLYQLDGTTIIPNNIFITAAQGMAGLRFTPSLNGTFNGSFEIQSSLSANDAGIDPLSGIVTATITVTPVNDMPVFTKGEDETVGENAGAQTLAGWATGIDDGDPEAIQGMTFNVTNNNNDLFSAQPAIGSDGTLTYTPSLGHTGIAQVTVTLTDDVTAGGSALTTAPQLFTITVNDITAPSQPSMPDLQSSSDSGVSGMDNTTNDNTPTFNISGVESLATVEVFANSLSLGTIQVPFGYSSVSFMPSSPMADGIYVITATQTDEGNNTSAESSAMAPNLVIDTTIPVITLLGLNPMTINAGTPYNEPGATVTEGLTATITGTVQIMIPGTYSMIYNATDLAGNNAVEVTRTVNVVNTAPVITQGESIDVSCSEDEVPTVFALTLNATDVEGHLLTWSIESQPANGTATASGTGTSKSIGYDPAPNWYGTDVFVVRVADGIAGGTDYITVNVTVDPLADTPSVTNSSTLEDTQTNSGLVITRNVNDGMEVTHFKISNIQNGKLYQNDGITEIYSGTFIPYDQGNTGLKFTPSLNSTADGRFDIQSSLRAMDSGIDPSSGTVTATILVTAINDSPVVIDIPGQTFPEGSVFSDIALDNYVSDIDNTDEEMAWTYSGNSSLGVSIDINRVATITLPDLDWNGSETITFRATDPGGSWAEDAATFTITAEADSPVVIDIPGQTFPEGSVFSDIALDNYVSDIDNTDEEMAWTYSGNSSLGVSIDINRVATITLPDLDWNGSETITFRATDPGGSWAEDAATFTITAEARFSCGN